MKMIDQKKPVAASPTTPSALLVAATAASQFGQANACAGSSHSRASRLDRSVRIFTMPRAYAPERAGAK